MLNSWEFILGRFAWILVRTNPYKGQCLPDGHRSMYNFVSPLELIYLSAPIDHWRFDGASHRKCVHLLSEPRRMRSPALCFSREFRATIKSTSFTAERRTARCSSERKRKGFMDMNNTSWRRCSLGSNHISAFGVWRQGERRRRRRTNRRGDTRWHRLPACGHRFGFDRSKLGPGQG